MRSPNLVTVLVTLTAGRSLLVAETAVHDDFCDENGEDQPVDTLSNPFSVLVQPGRVLVADAGANDVLAVDTESGEISTFFVPPVVTETPECEAAENNPGTVGCDPVPTEITEGPDGLVYLDSEFVPAGFEEAAIEGAVACPAEALIVEAPTGA